MPKLLRNELCMTEKRYKSYKYVFCFCERHDRIQVGVDGYKYLTSIGTLGGVAFTLLVLFSTVDILSKLTVIFLLGLPAILGPALSYVHTKEIMLKAGHSEGCSSKIAFKYTLRASVWSEFRIMKAVDDNKR